MDEIRRSLKLLAVATTVLYIALGIALLVIYINLGQKSDAIQDSRLVSCERTYESFNEVFKPFFRPAAQRTKKEQSDFDKLHNKIKELKDRCSTQISTHGEQPKKGG